VIIQANKIGSNANRDRRSWVARRRVALAVLGVLVLLAAAVAVGSSSAAEVQGPATFNGVLGVREYESRPTRVYVAFAIYPHGSATDWKLEYATSESGPWTPVASGVTDEYGGVSREVDHLSPATHYYLRAEVKNEHGGEQQTIAFATPAVRPPEFLQPNCVATGYYEIGPNICGRAGASVVSFGFDIYSAGAETSWSAEYSSSKSAVEEGKGIPVSGGAGTISVGEEDSQFNGSLSGLAPEKTYYLRVKATNAKGHDHTGGQLHHACAPRRSRRSNAQRDHRQLRSSGGVARCSRAGNTMAF
jgi:phosphodiesterase/alkaline phosphatase D-like protein